MNYDVDYFIKKFEAIPEDEWCVDSQIDNSGRSCAYGHCMRISRLADESFYILDKELGRGLYLTWVGGNKPQQETVFADINNGYYKEYQQPTPKQRILAALYDIKAMQQPKERIRYVAVDAEVKEIINTQIFN